MPSVRPLEWVTLSASNVSVLVSRGNATNEAAAKNKIAAKDAKDGDWNGTYLHHPRLPNEPSRLTIEGRRLARGWCSAEKCCELRRGIEFCANEKMYGFVSDMRRDQWEVKDRPLWLSSKKKPREDDRSKWRLHVPQQPRLTAGLSSATTIGCRSTETTRMKHQAERCKSTYDLTLIFIC